MIEINGDLFTSDSTALGHGVNVEGLMGAGIAPYFARLFPQMYMDYRALCAAKLLHPGDVHVHTTLNLTIYNIASQDRPGKHARLDWLLDGVDAALDHAQSVGHSVLAIPRIGCGIGGLQWLDVGRELESLSKGYTTQLHVYSL